MPINWDPFDDAARHALGQPPLEERERLSLERLAWRLLQCSETLLQEEWGTAWPARGSVAAVIQIRRDLPHRFQQRASELGIENVGIQIYNADSKGCLRFDQVLPFHNELSHQLPGLPNPHVQQTIQASWEVDDSGTRRGVVIEQFVGGISLETLIERPARTGPIPREIIFHILEQMTGRVVFPLWHAGVIGFHFSTPNWRYDSKSRHLTLIHFDSLAGDVRHILHRPADWDELRIWEERCSLLVDQFAGELWRMLWRMVLPHIRRGRDSIRERLYWEWEQTVADRIREFRIDREFDPHIAQGVFTRFLGDVSKSVPFKKNEAWNP